MSLLSLPSLVDDQDGLNNYADAILTEQDRFKNHSKDWKTSLTIDHPSIQVVFGLALCAFEIPQCLKWQDLVCIAVPTILNLYPEVH